MAVVFSPDSKRVLSASYDGMLQLWDPTGNLAKVRVLRGHGKAVTGAAFSRDGKWIASSSTDSTIRLWDAETGEELATLRGHDPSSQWLTAVAFHPDGTRLASVAGDSRLKIWDLQAALGSSWPGAGGNGRTKFADAMTDTKGLCDLALSPDNRFLALGRVLPTGKPGSQETLGQVELWDVATGQRTATLDAVTLKRSEPFLHLKRVAFSADGKRLATVDARVSWSFASDQGIPPPTDVKVWEVATGNRILTLEKAGEQVVFSPDGRWIAVTRTSQTVDQPDGKGGSRRRQEGGRVRFWDAHTGKPAFALPESAAPIGRLAFTPDGRHLITTRKEVFGQGSIRVWK